MTAITDMTPAELRIACAEKCGWKNIRWLESISGKWLCGDLPNKDSEIPKFQTDRNALFELVKTIPEYKHGDFVEAIFEIHGINVQLFSSALEGYSWDGNIPEALWGLLTADPITIMRAFLTVMEITSKYH